MRLIPGLTSTDPAAMAAFLEELRASRVRTIAFFPTCLDRAARERVYRGLEAVEGLRIPHVHIRGDMGEDELSYLAERFGTEAFNIHPRRSKHPYTGEPGPWRPSIFVENADAVPEAAELEGAGGLCVDFAHWETWRLERARGEARGPDYSDFAALASSHRVGCCHISAVRPGIRSSWGGFDHHRFSTPADLDYVLAYQAFFPERWASLELENGLGDQVEAIARLETLLGMRA